MIKNVLEVEYHLEGLETSSREDVTRSTGATLFYFPDGALAQTDIRGGSAATSETSLLEAGSMSSWIDGVAFAGGSTMGLAVADGIREFLFKKRGSNAKNFDLIPSVPAAVVYDFGRRPFPYQDQLVYPNKEMGFELMNHLSKKSFMVGRAGAGLSTSTNKISKRIWGGQGLVYKDLGYAKIVAAVINNAMGNIIADEIRNETESGRETESGSGNKSGSYYFTKTDDSETTIAIKENTTLSILITDLKLTQNDLKRLAVQVHTGMASSIFPFHSFSDGDTHFSVSTEKQNLPVPWNFDHFVKFSIEASLAMKEAILLGSKVANQE